MKIQFNTDKTITGNEKDQLYFNSLIAVKTSYIRQRKNTPKKLNIISFLSKLEFCFIRKIKTIEESILKTVTVRNVIPTFFGSIDFTLRIAKFPTNKKKNKKVCVPNIKLKLWPLRKKNTRTKCSPKRTNANENSGINFFIGQNYSSLVIFNTSLMIRQSPIATANNEKIIV